MVPYIKKEQRVEFDFCIKDLNPENAGQLNYVITMLCNEYLTKKGRNYENYNSVIGVLECAKLEYYRRAVVGYENEKIKDNGDLYE